VHFTKNRFINMELQELSLSEIKERSLLVLKFVDKVCKDRGITYYLAAGTLLGAVRHKGFIPWDDDIDIMMPRSDYERLIREFPVNDDFEFMTLHNCQHFPFAFGKIIDLKTLKKEPLRKKYQNQGVEIDVFPIDNYPDDLKEAEEWCNTIKKTQDKMLRICAPYAMGRNLFRTIVKNIIVALVHLLDDIKIVSAHRLVIQLDKLSQKYNSQVTHYCGIAAIAAYGVKKRNRNDVFSGKAFLEFEGNNYPVPIGYDEYLTDYYGDYMKLPPVEKRQTHHLYKAFWK